MKIIRFTATTLALALALAAGSAYAKVSNQEANKLGKQLTAVGAEVAASANGTIPAYSGGLAKDTGVDPYTNIYAHEKPLFVINKSNLNHYKNNLTPGQVAMFEKYPDTYKMPIYPTHRTANYPKNILAKAKKNATSAELLDAGNGLTHFDETVPFAIPQNGLEVIWNHVTRFKGGNSQQNRANIPVQRNGTFQAIKVRSQLAFPQYLEGGYDAKADKNVLFYYTNLTKSPARLTGNVLLVHETIDQISEPRKAWQYNAGQRRVRRAPQVAYDAPNTNGLRTTDQVDMYNGAPDRYNWKIVGKKEIYIPYNSYKMIDKDAKYTDIIRAGHINQDYARYELHRVWHLEATLKDDARHVYGKRSLYLDEDSWQIAVADHYDTRGNLWRVAEGHAMQFVNVNTTWYSSITNYDLISGRYMAQLNNEERDSFKFDSLLKRKDFTTAAIRRSGKR
ncbi:MAG: DUF1329 domain-containing protein [Bermanella sp.]